MADDFSYLIKNIAKQQDRKPSGGQEPPQIRQTTSSPQQTALARQNSTSNVSPDAPSVIISNKTSDKTISAPFQRVQQDSSTSSIASTIPTGNVVSSPNNVPPSTTSDIPTELKREISSIIDDRSRKLDDTILLVGGYGDTASEQKDLDMLSKLSTALHTGTLDTQPKAIKSLYQSIKNEAKRDLATKKDTSEQYKNLEFHENSDVYKS
jgi:hypothetical protein